MSLYVDGGVALTATDVTSFSHALDVVVGRLGKTRDLGYFEGLVDELAVFDRPLTQQEVTDFFQRGALRLQFQARACDDGLCAGESFVGPDGTPHTYYSELSNASPRPPSVLLSNLPTPGARYFQYRAYLESDLAGDWPRLEQATAGKAHYGDGTLTPRPGVLCNQPLTDTLVCDLGDIAPGATETVTLALRVRDTFTGSLISNAAQVMSAVYERDKENDSDEAESGVRRVGFASDGYYVGEDDGAATITVTLSAAPSVTVTVGYGMDDGTATAGDDYVQESGTLIFEPGGTSQAFAVTINQDDLDEHNEQVYLTLSDSSTTATLTIEDADPLPTVRFDPGEYSVSETDAGASIETITVTLSPQSGRLVTVDYAAEGGTATAGTDYVAVGGTLTFSQGMTSQVFSVTVASDNLDEREAETIGLVLNNVPFATITGANPVTLTIYDDDWAPVVDLSGPDSVGIDFETTFVEDGDAVSIVDADLSVSDGDDVQLFSAVITLTNRPNGDKETLAADAITGTNITIIDYDPSVGTLVLTGTDTVTNYQRVLRTVTYGNTSNHPDLAQNRIIEFVVNDGANDSDVALCIVSIYADNDPPELDLDDNAAGTGYSTSFTEGDDPVRLANRNDVNVTDPDDDDMVSATVTLTNCLDTTDEMLMATASQEITVSYNSSACQLSLVGVSSLNDYEDILDSVFYNNISQNPDITERRVEFVVNDGVNDSNVAVCTITINAVNDPPNAEDDNFTVVISGTITENVLSNDTDPEDDNLTVIITPVSEPEDGTLTLSEGGTFTYTHDGSSAESDNFVYRVCDDGVPSECDTATVTINVEQPLLTSQSWALIMPVWLPLPALSSLEPAHPETALPRVRWLTSGRPRGAFR
jgi:hypothetical protein